MAYGLMTDFLYEVGEDVGEFLTGEEKANFTPSTLEDIVKNYVDERNLLNAFFLKKQIKNYMAAHLSAEGLSYAHPPFGQETSFVEDHFEGDLYAFLTSVMRLLDKELKARSKRILPALLKQK